MGYKILKLAMWPWPRLFHDSRQAGTCNVNLPTKFEVPVFAHYGNMTGVAKCRKCGGLGWLTVTQCHWK